LSFFEKKKNKLIFIIIIVLALSLGIPAITETKEDSEGNWMVFGIIRLEIFVLAVGLVVTGIGTGVGLFFTAMENKGSRDEKNLSMLGNFSNQISNLKDKERQLKTKKDCEIYAQNFVDLMDQIAFLHIEETIPSKVTKYFENEFAYALTMIEWLENYNIDKGGKKRENEIKWEEHVKTLNVINGDKKEYTWSSLIKWCQKLKKPPIEPIEYKSLPPAMLKYDLLPEEEISTAIDLIKGYSEQITELKNRERQLKTQKDCEIYAQNFVDLMDQIAFLYVKNMFPADLTKYFENEFAYALTMIEWLGNNNIEIGSKRKAKGAKWNDYVKSLELRNGNKEEFVWSSLIEWCQVRRTPPIEPIEYELLPPSMLEFKNLPKEEIDTTIGMMKEYGDKLSELTQKEKNFKDDSFLDCELYAISYLDLVDQIAFLHLKNMFPEELTRYFENNFCYALTLYNWLKENKLSGPVVVIEKEEQNNDNGREIEDINQWIKSKGDTAEVSKEFTWTDLMSWCKSEELEPFEQDQLPPKMRNMKVPEEFWLDRYKKNKN